MRWRLACPLVFLLSAPLAAAPAAAEEIPGSRIAFGNWSGGAWRGDDGAFSHCAVSARYVSGFELLFSVNSDASVTVGLAAPDFGAIPGETFPATLTIDRRANFSGTAEAVSDDLVVFRIADMDAALAALRKGRVLTVRSGDFRQEFNLSGTFRALDDVLDCAVAYYNADQRAAAPRAAAGGAPADKTLLFQLATSMISDAAVTDFRYLTPAELDDLAMPDAVIWLSEADRLMGGVMLSDARSGVDLRQASAAAAQNLSASCDGDAATSSMDASVDGLPAREVRVVCKAADGLTETIFSQVVVEDMLLETFFTFAGEAASPDGKSARQAMPAEAALKAASLVREIQE